MGDGLGIVALSGQGVSGQGVPPPALFKMTDYELTSFLGLYRDSFQTPTIQNTQNIDKNLESDLPVRPDKDRGVLVEFADYFPNSFKPIRFELK